MRGVARHAEVMAARRELDRDQRGTLGSRRRPGTSFERPAVSAAANVAGRNPNSAGIFMLPGASITNATSSFERLAIRLTMLGCDFEVRPPPALVEYLRVLGAGVTPYGPRLSAASRSVRLAGTAHGGVALQIPSGRWASSQPACTNR